MRIKNENREELAARQGCTVLLATHSADEAFDLCDRVAILDRGRVAAVGRVEQLMARVSDDRYRVRVRTEQVPVLLRHAAARNLTDVETLPALEEDGWTTLELNITGGETGAAAFLGAATGAGLEISGFERRGLSLADLLERITGSTRELAHA
ncbi:MAG TPA: hypothetical protein VK966_03730 [Longimicrobiales bacterium]|nr:hypothetical protein [Longimicrobiales bacterium]